MAMKEHSGSGHSKTLLGPPAIVLVGDWNWPLFLHGAKKSQLLTVDSGLVDCFWFVQQQHKNKIGFWVLVLFCTFPFYSGWFLTPFHSFLVAFLLVLFPVFFASAPVIMAVFPKATAIINVLFYANVANKQMSRYAYLVTMNKTVRSIFHSYRWISNSTQPLPNFPLKEIFYYHPLCAPLIQ